MDIDRIFIVRQEHIELKRAAEKMVQHHAEVINGLNGTISSLQSNCTHRGYQYAEGRHGSDKGTAYFRCSLCKFEWDDG